MILLVDDDPVYLELTRTALEADEHGVEAFTDPAAAMACAGRATPDLVVCDVLMPEMDGHEFHRRYQETFSGRETPFIFLSGLAEPTHIIQALNDGALDYVSKPVDPGVLCAKVRSLLRRTQLVTRVFRGDLSEMGFPRLLRHCEESGLTGSLAIESDGLRVQVRFAAGRLDEASAPDELLARLLDLPEGRFTVRSEAAAVKGLTEAGAAPRVGGPSRPQTGDGAPAGRLSAVRVGARLVQIQTEVSGTGSDLHVVTLALHNGRTLLRREVTPSRPERGMVEGMVEKLHLEVEGEVRRKLEQLVGKMTGVKADTSPTGRFNELYRQGIEKYEDGNYAAALMLWEMAVAIDPTNRVLTVQIEAARKRAFSGTCLDGGDGAALSSEEQ